MNFSVITTTLNESPNVNVYLETLNKQTLIPSELIVVDAISSDDTVKLFESFPSNQFPIHVHSISCTRGKGRNYAVSQAKEDLIVSLDVGVNPDSNCLEEIYSFFKNNPDVHVASGRVVPDPKNTLEKAFSLFLPKDPTDHDLKNQGWIPGSRLFAFRKEAFYKAGGYPEKQNTAEDIPFTKSLINAGYYIGFIENAKATYPPCKNWLDFFKQYFGYSKGDGIAFNFEVKYLIKILVYSIGLILALSGFVFNICWILLLVGIIAYIGFGLLKTSKMASNKKIILMGPLLELVNDLAEISGFVTGLLSALFITPVSKRENI